MKGWSLADVSFACIAVDYFAFCRPVYSLHSCGFVCEHMYIDSVNLCLILWFCFQKNMKGNLFSLLGFVNSNRWGTGTPTMASPLYYAIAVLLTIIILILIIIIFFVFRSSNSPKSRGLPPGSYGWPILGESLEFIRTRNQGSSAKYNTQVFKTSLLGESVAVLCGSAGNKFLFSNEHKLVTVWWPASVRKLLGTCISTFPGPEGVRMRKMTSYFFSPDAFTKLYIKTVNEVSHQHLNAHWYDSQGCKGNGCYQTLEQDSSRLQEQRLLSRRSC